jgi:hypothetical protein
LESSFPNPSAPSLHQLVRRYRERLDAVIEVIVETVKTMMKREEEEEEEMKVD